MFLNYKNLQSHKYIFRYFTGYSVSDHRKWRAMGRVLRLKSNINRKGTGHHKGNVEAFGQLCY
jgi:hypothetical protein